VVYASSEKRLLQLTGNHHVNPTLSLPCREVFARGQRDIEVVGPLFEDETAVRHQDFWRQPGYFIRTRNYGGGLGETDRAMGEGLFPIPHYPLLITNSPHTGVAW